MEQMKKLLIAEASETEREALCSIFQERYRIATCGDGFTAGELLTAFRPDILVIDLMLPRLDGLTVLRQASTLPPIILVTTTAPTWYVEQALMDLGVGYIIRKPCSVTAVARHIADMEQQLLDSRARSDARITDQMRLLGVDSRRDGFKALRVSISMYAQDPSQSIVKELYNHVASICGKENWKQVEKNMRDAIRKAWENRDESIWARYFRVGNDGFLPCPTTKEFIARIADTLAVVS